MLAITRIAACWAAMLALGACTTILDTHSSGDGPAGPGPIPGPPAGDSVTAQGDVVFNGGNIQLVYDPDTPVQTGVALIVTGRPHDTTEYAISFSGVKLTIEELPVLAIDALDTDHDVACGLEIAGGEFRLVGGSGTEVIGTYTGAADEHRVFLRLDLGLERCFVRIEQVAQGTDGPPVQPLIVDDAPFVSDQFGELDRVQVAWEQPEPDNPTSYFLGPTVISKRN